MFLVSVHRQLTEGRAEDIMRLQDLRQRTNSVLMAMSIGPAKHVKTNLTSCGLCNVLYFRNNHPLQGTC